MNKLLKINVIIVFLSLYFILEIQAEVKNIGTPRVRTYTNTEIQAGTQTWMIDIGANGLVYFANNDGILEFDALTWRKYPLPGRTVVRSVKTTADGRIYAGGHNEFGYFAGNNAGQLVFKELHHLLPATKRDFGEVWKIYETNAGLVFQSFTQLMIYRDDTLKVVDAPDMFHFSFMVGNELYINDQTKGLFCLKGDRLEKLAGTEKLDGQLIWAMLPKGNDMLIATADAGIFVYKNRNLSEWKNATARLLKQMQVFCAIPVNPGIYAFGTIQDGLIICDTSGKLIQHINIDKGLQNSTVLSLQKDAGGNLWLGLDNGIDYIETNSPLTYFSASNNLSSGYTAVIHDGRLYLGTNRGVFYHNWEALKTGGSDQKFTLVPGTQGQVWSLEVIDGSLFCGHNSGIFLIEGTYARMLSNIQGGWTFYQPKGRKDMVICGTYTYLVKISRQNGIWQNGTRIQGYRESSRYMASAGSQSLWISHGYKGVYRVHFNTAYDSVVRTEFFNSRHGFPSDKDINVFTIKGQPVFTTGRGIFRFSAATGRFDYDNILSNSLTRNDMNILKEDSQGNLWYFTTASAGVYRLQEDGNYSEVEIPFRELKDKFIKWFQFVYPHDENNVFIGTQSGFVHYSPAFSKNYRQPFRAFIRRMQILSKTDSVLYYGAVPPQPFFSEIPYRFNQLQFEFTANDYENAGEVTFLTKLEGFDSDWVEWKNSVRRQFTNLRHGDYRFSVKAINVFGAESEVAAISFKILPPWYLSRYAYAGYGLLLVISVLAVVRYVRYRVEQTKKAVETEQRQLFMEREKQLQIESLLAEQEVIKLRNEKLQAEKVQKDKELANTTMQIIQKSKSLTNLKNDLRKLALELGKHPAVGQVQVIIRKINRSIESEKQWEVFEHHFENVHEEFLKRLKENYPELSPRELKLCAYLRLNISSKEIASLMNISVRGVEISRYRLRKKLKLEHDINLTDFILTY